MGGKAPAGLGLRVDLVGDKGLSDLDLGVVGDAEFVVAGRVCRQLEP